MLFWVSRQASLHSSLQYHVGVLHKGVEKWLRASVSASDVPSYECYATLPLRQASESASDVPSCERYAARQTDMIMWSHQPHAQTSCRGHHCRKTWPQGSFHFLVSAPSSCHTGDSNSYPPDLKLGALTKWLASRCWSECLGRLLYSHANFGFGSFLWILTNEHNISLS